MSRPLFFDFGLRARRALYPALDTGVFRLACLAVPCTLLRYFERIPRLLNDSKIQ